jgi:S1-C subfamily serine protease
VAIALPLAVDSEPVGTCFPIASRDGMVAFVTTLHQLGKGGSVQVGIPPHQGDLSNQQPYPIRDISALESQVVLTEPFLDLGILVSRAPGLSFPSTKLSGKVLQMNVGEEVIVIGYPYTPMGSYLETAQRCHISALGSRLSPGGNSRPELVLSVQVHPGSSGSPVVRHSDGTVCGVVRGSLAPPSPIKMGGIPLGSDSSVTYAIGVDRLQDLIDDAFEMKSLISDK